MISIHRRFCFGYFSVTKEEIFIKFECASLLKSLTVRVFAPYMRVRAWIIMKINMLVDKYTESLSFKFYDDPLIGCGEIAKSKPSMHTYHFLMYF